MQANNVLCRSAVNDVEILCIVAAPSGPAAPSDDHEFNAASRMRQSAREVGLLRVGHA
jgi:hypothetical protein